MVINLWGSKALWVVVLSALPIL